MNMQEEEEEEDAISLFSNEHGIDIPTSYGTLVHMGLRHCGSSSEILQDIPTNVEVAHLYRYPIS